MDTLEIQILKDNFRAVNRTDGETIVIKKAYVSKIKKEYNLVNQTEFKKEFKKLPTSKNETHILVDGQHRIYPLYTKGI